MTKKDTTVSVDDLTAIEGIGPTIAQKLQDAGIHTYAQLAAMTPAKLAPLVVGVRGLSSDRIIELDWVGQANSLSQKQTHQQPTNAGNGQHYARFDVEFLLEEDNQVRRTKIKHRPDGKEVEWSGWREKKLLKFFVTEMEMPKIQLSQPEPETTIKWLPDDEEKLKQVLRKFVVFVEEMGSPRHFLLKNQDFNVHVDIDLSNIESPQDIPLHYNAAVIAKNLSNGNQKKLGLSQGKITGDSLSIDLPGRNLDPGTYRLQVQLGFNLESQPTTLTRVLPGGLLQVQS
jgi:hypothetical protein